MFKRLSAIFIALIMCLSLMTPAFAAVTATTEASIIVKKVDDNGTDSDVVAYKIIEPTFDGVDDDGNPTGTGNFLGWQWTKAAQNALGLSDNDKDYVTQITTKQFNTLVKALRSSTKGFTSLTLTGNADGSYSTNAATAGSYVVLITPNQNAGMVYNPLLVSVNIEAEEESGDTVDNVLVSGTVNADGDFVANAATGVIGEGEGSIVYAKSSTIYINKTTEDEEGNEVTNGSLGDEVPYVVTTTVPTYSTNDYTTVQFTVSDSLSDGLDYVIPEGATQPTISVQYLDVDGKTYKDVVNTDNLAYTISYNTNTPRTFSIAFISQWILNNPGTQLKISYTAEINSDAVTGFDPNTNTATLNYTNDPTGEVSELTDKYREYTFSIDGAITQNTQILTNNRQINFIKTGQNEENDTSIDTQYGPVAGAGFALYDNEELTGKPIRTAETGLDGMFVMKQLGEGTYWLVETKAPAGYALDSIPRKVVITAEIEDDILKSYTVAIGNEGEVKSSTYRATYTNTQELSTVTVDAGSTFYEFINTTISSLPSTGSYGTYAFILVGCIIMATALTMFVVKRKESK